MRNPTGSWLLVVSASLALLLPVGCSGKREDKWTRGRPPVYPASGQLLLDGEPVEKATVTFQPIDAVGKPGSAITDRNGYFQVTTFDPGDGLTTGRHRVAVQKTHIVDQSGNIVTEIREPGGLIEKNFLPKRYADFQKSGLKVTVEESRSNDLGQINLSK